MSQGEIDLLTLYRPMLEAYHEMRQRAATSEWTSERAREITLLLTGDLLAAEDAANAVEFRKKLE